MGDRRFVIYDRSTNSFLRTNYNKRMVTVEAQVADGRVILNGKNSERAVYADLNEVARENNVVTLRLAHFLFVIMY